MYTIKRWDKDGKTVEVERLTQAEMRDMVEIELEYNSKITAAGYFEFKETGLINPKNIKKRFLTKDERARLKKSLEIGTARAEANGNSDVKGLGLTAIKDSKRGLNVLNAPRIPEEIINFESKFIPKINFNPYIVGMKHKKRK